MEQLNGESCYRCFIPTSLKWRRGRSKHGWITWRKKAIRKDFSIAQTLLVTFFTCVLFKATLEETKLTDHCKITWKFHRIGLNTFSALVLLMICILLPNQDCSQEENIRKKYDKRYPSQQWILRIFRRMNLMTWQNHDTYLTERDWQCARTQHVGSFWKMLSIEDWYLGKRIPVPSAFVTPYQPTVLKKWWNTQTEKILYQKTHSSPRLHQQLAWGMPGKFNAKIIINVEAAQGNLLRTRERWNPKMCSERNRPGGQTPSSERVRQVIDTNFLCGPGSDVGALDEAPGEERSDGNGVNLTLRNDVKDTGWECACGRTMNDADTTLSWATECAVCAHEKKCAVARSRKCILCTKQISKIKDSHMLPSNKKDTVEHGWLKE